MSDIVIFCTLFDSNYLDKGLVLYDSLKNTVKEFCLYILAMDDKCFDILSKLSLESSVVISLEMFEDEELKRIKKSRTRAEYCWTCTASLIDYIFETYDEKYCTYLDADLYFYKNPEILIQEMLDNGCSAQIVKHGFGKNAEIKEKEAGKYCVQFNTFKNDKGGRTILAEWKKQCRNHCSMEPGELGDQKYLTDWAERYSRVHVLEHQGGGVAPWNIERYKIYKKENSSFKLQDKKSKIVFDLIFYHFHHLEYINEYSVNINVFKRDMFINRKLTFDIYFSYLKAIEDKKKMLKSQFDFAPMLHKHPGIKSTAEKHYLEKMKGKSLAEIYNMILVKMVYIMGTKRDIIQLDQLP